MSVLITNAYARGYRAARAGQPAGACPHTDGAPRYRRAWLAGWNRREPLEAR